ncbi:MAG TPA: cytochrome c peroxidase [Candidatus Berkiella sp.]|nr:cytochrome c peroxidase [Candidatus Berkiella sp.]
MLRLKALIPFLLTALISQDGFAQKMQQPTGVFPISASPADPAKIELGKKLYQEPMFAKDLSASCASCHQLKNAGVDNLPQYIGMNKQVGTVNTPTILNVSLNFRQFWDGRAKSIAEAISDHVQDKSIFDSNWPTIVQHLSENSIYSEDFKKIYPQGITKATIEDALTVYIENLLTINSNFDKFMAGDRNALTNDAQKGFRLFKKYGCIFCHQGPNLGGNLYQRLGIYKDYYADKGPPKKSDLGLYNVTGKPEDKYVFKVPTLRNISRTGPYLHDGSIKTLPEMIQLMAIYQVGQPLRNDEVNSIATFLQSLNGQPDNDLITNQEK